MPGKNRLAARVSFFFTPFFICLISELGANYNRISGSSSSISRPSFSKLIHLSSGNFPYEIFLTKCSALNIYFTGIFIRIFVIRSVVQHHIYFEEKLRDSMHYIYEDCLIIFAVDLIQIQVRKYAFIFLPIRRSYLRIAHIASCIRFGTNGVCAYFTSLCV